MQFTAKLEEARQKLPLKSLMEKHGRVPSNGNWIMFPKCPYCDGDKCAGVYSREHRDLFKCHRSGCRSGTSDTQASWDEIGFLAFELNVDRREATRAWLKEAGVWCESEQIPPGQKTRGEKTRVEAGDENSSSVVRQENAEVSQAVAPSFVPPRVAVFLRE